MVVPFQITNTMNYPNENERRRITDRRDGEDRRDGRDRRLVEDRKNARRLPDEFAQRAGDSGHRINGLVNRYWGDFSASERGELTKALLPVLEGLAAPGVPVTEKHRDRCVEVVVGWAAGLEPVSTE